MHGSGHSMPLLVLLRRSRAVVGIVAVPASMQPLVSIAAVVGIVAVPAAMLLLVLPVSMLAVVVVAGMGSIAGMLLLQLLQLLLHLCSAAAAAALLPASLP